MQNIKNSCKISSDEERKIVHWYVNHTLRNTASTFRRDRKTIIKVLTKNNVLIRPTQEDLLIAKEAIKQTNLEKYGVENPMQSKEIQEKAKKTCLEKYGYSSYLATTACREKFKQVCLKKYGVENVLSLEENQILAKRAIFKKYGAEYAMQNITVKNKKLTTQKVNKHMSTSRPEETFYELLQQYFDVDDIKRQYNKDARYPYLCDFYIRSLDLFIEINYYYTHGTHPYNPENKEDLERLEVLKNKGWQHVINVWTCRDVEKYKKAKMEHINYLVYYPKDNLVIDRVLAFVSNK